jgi:hypothetical protein
MGSKIFLRNVKDLLFLQEKALDLIKLELFPLYFRNLKIMKLLMDLGMLFLESLKVHSMPISFLFIIPIIKVILIKLSNTFKIFGLKSDPKMFTKISNLEFFKV